MVEQTKLTKQSFDEAEHDIKNYSQELLIVICQSDNDEKFLSDPFCWSCKPDEYLKTLNLIETYF